MIITVDNKSEVYCVYIMYKQTILTLEIAFLFSMCTKLMIVMHEMLGMIKVSDEFTNMSPMSYSHLSE